MKPVTLLQVVNTYEGARSILSLSDLLLPETLAFDLARFYRENASLHEEYHRLRKLIFRRHNGNINLARQEWTFPNAQHEQDAREAVARLEMHAVDVSLPIVTRQQIDEIKGHLPGLSAAFLLSLVNDTTAPTFDLSQFEPAPSKSDGANNR